MEINKKINGESKNDFLPEKVRQLEQVCGKYSVLFYKLLPEDSRVLAYCGPASFRDPEEDNVWHPYLINASFGRFLCDQSGFFVRAIYRGIRSFVFLRFRKFTWIHKEGANTIGFAPVLICHPKEKSVETTYCHPDDATSMSWLLFEDGVKTYHSKDITRMQVLKLFFSLVGIWFKLSMQRPKECAKSSWAIASALTLRWVFQLKWVNEWMYIKKVQRVIEEQKPQRVFCLHEIHPHSRILWHECDGRDIKRLTVQHSMITREKLWFFPTKRETTNGLKLFDEISVFSPQDLELLKTYYGEDVKYDVFCGPRFAHWKNKNPKDFAVTDEQKNVLFVTSLPWWDCEVVFSAMAKLLKEKKCPYSLAMRLHPTANVSRHWKKWLVEKQKTGEIKCVQGALSEAVLSSSVVIGLNSTVLEEALLMGKLSFAINQGRFLSFISPHVLRISFENFEWGEIEKILKDSRIENNQYSSSARDSLGINYDVYRACK